MSSTVSGIFKALIELDVQVIAKILPVYTTTVIEASILSL
jgi:hypothetical protein